MADRQPARKTADNLAASAHDLPAARKPGSATAQPATSAVPARKVGDSAAKIEPAATPGAELDLADEDTVNGDLILAEELDTQTVPGEDLLLSLDLSEELAELGAARPNAGGTSPPAQPVVVATAVSPQAAASTAAAIGDDAAGRGKKLTWASRLLRKKGSEGSVTGGSTPSGPNAGSENRGAALTAAEHKATRHAVGGEILTEGLPRKGLRDRLLMRSVPSWLISMMLHMAILMTLAAIQLEPVREAMGVLLTADAGDDAGTTLADEFEIRGPDLDAPPATAELEESLSTPSEFTAQEIALPETTSLAAAMQASAEVGSVGSLVESILPSSALNAATARMSSSLSGRLSGAMKSEMLERFGGNAASEKSVAMALKWLSDHQDRSGGWTFGHSHICRGQCKDDGELVEATNAATALALLPFLGAGQTHLEGNYKATVHNGLKFLISRMKVTGGTLPTGSWREEEAGGNMYSHGLASIVICEAYAMTRDPDLLQPAQLALNYIVFAQDPRGGGWRYKPKEPGDTSVVGWQLMALKSGAMGNLSVPHETFRLANSFLDSMAVNDGAFYGYDQPTSNVEGLGATTAVGLLCRMYLGWSKDQPGLQAGVKYLSERGPNVEDVYYSYYATQVLRQYGGPEWTKWNTAMRDGLIKSQVKDGHAAGSWYSAQGFNTKGGRLYCTAMSAMMLEVYYRHMPLYSEKSSDDDFEL